MYYNIICSQISNYDDSKCHNPRGYQIYVESDGMYVYALIPSPLLNVLIDASCLYITYTDSRYLLLVSVAAGMIQL